MTFPEYFFFGYVLLTSIFILNVWILIVAEKQRKRILAETVVSFTSSNGQSANEMSRINRFFHTGKAVETFSIFALLTFCL